MSCRCRRNCPARAVIGSGRECIIHERNALDPASASVRLALSAWMSCRRSRIPHALAVFDRRFAGSRLTSGRGSVRLDSFPGHRYFVRLSGGLSPASALRALSTASLACLTTWNLSMILAALGKWPRMPLANPGPMSHVTGRTRSGSPSSAMKSLANRSTACAALIFLAP